MSKPVSIFLLACVLGGCTTTSQTYGNFVQSAMPGQQKLAIDAAQQLAVLYAPAHTRVELRQPTPDPFGQALVQSLRDKGYALLEFTSVNPVDSVSDGVGMAKLATTPVGLPLRYVLDQTGDSNLYRLSLHVGDHHITRPYLAQNGQFLPAGYWARKE